ncbi:MAG: GSCFA domain-containing protein [Muribaculaceae bacterium]|nr:GSCFA domain-containing protein [Muribaculaceae bacterium]
MQFRTEIESIKNAHPINHSSGIVMIGSCFTDEIGSRLSRDGFNVTFNPMGALYNPFSIATVIERATNGKIYSQDDLVFHEGYFHCLDFPSTFRNVNPDALLEKINHDLIETGRKLSAAETWIITFGTSRIYSLDGLRPIGNCHKLPSSRFEVSLLNVNDIVCRWNPLLNKHIIFTVSPIRHLADGLHGNMLSKSILLQSIEELQSQASSTCACEYFPAFEIMLDDLRDYRFYAADMKHPSPVAVDYIYEKFSDTYFSPATKKTALECRKKAIRAAHRPILEQ